LDKAKKLEEQLLGDARCAKRFAFPILSCAPKALRSARLSLLKGFDIMKRLSETGSGGLEVRS
jgi:hypothetical protein